MENQKYPTEFGEYIKKRLSHYNIECSIEAGRLLLQASVKDVYNVISFLQHDTHCQFERLENIFSMQEAKGERFLCYVLHSMEKKFSMIVKVKVLRSVRSVAEIYKSAHWLEREIWERHDVLFEEHKDLRRLFLEN